MTEKYVKPETGGGSPAGSGTFADPYNGLAIASGGGILSPGDILYLKDGTYLGEQMDMASTGAAGSPLVIKALNPGKAILDGNAKAQTFAINIGQKTYVHIEDLIITDYATNGIQFTCFSHAPTGCRVRRCHIYDLGTFGSGITTDPVKNNDASGFVLTDFVIEDNVVHDVGIYGIAIRSAVSQAVIRRNLVERAANTTTNGWGIAVLGQNSGLVTSSSWVNVSGQRYSFDLSLISTGHENNTVYEVIYNSGTLAGRYLLAPGGSGTDTFSSTTGSVEIDIGEDPNGKTFMFLYTPAASGVVIERNRVSATGNGGGNNDGVGIGLDDGMGSCIVRDNLVLDCEGDSFQFHNVTDSPLIYGNLSLRSGRTGFTVAGTGNSANVSLYHNVAVSETTSGFAVRRTSPGDTTTIKNCISLSTATGLDNTSGDINGTLTESSNGTFGHTTAGFSTSVVLEDPRLVGPEYLTELTDNYWSAGETVTGFHDVYPNQHGAWLPSIGRDDGGLAMQMLRRRRRA